MPKIDIGIGLVLVAAVLFSLLGVATYEREGQPIEFTVVWATEEEAVPPKNRQRTGPGSETVEVPLTIANVTSVSFTVTVTGVGPRVQAAQWSARVEAPNRTASQPRGGTFAAGAGEATGVERFGFAVQPVPSRDRVEALSEEAARAELEPSYNPSAGQGTWRVTVTFQGGNPPGLAPETYRIQVAATATVFQASVTPTVPDVESR